MSDVSSAISQTYGDVLRVYRSSPDICLVVVAVTVAMGLAVTETHHATARLAFALPSALFFPGYAITAAAFPKRTPSVTTRLLLSLGLSLVTTIVCGLLLNLTPWGLQASSWAIMLGGVTLSASAVALKRRSPLPVLQLNFGLNLRQGLLLGLAGGVVLAAILVARTGALTTTTNFIQLWILPASEREQDAIRVGIANSEPAAAKYRLRLVAGEELIHEWASIVLMPGEVWETVVHLPPSYDVEELEAQLYRLEAPHEIYRRVTLWHDVQGR